MLTGSRQLRTFGISWAALALCLALGGTFITSCSRPTVSEATSDFLTPVPGGPILRADPNPVLKGNPDGTTIITWDTGANDVGDVYVGEEDNEKLFASGAKGSQSAPGIKPGATKFRLYTKTDHKLLAELIVTMPPP